MVKPFILLTHLGYDQKDVLKRPLGVLRRRRLLQVCVLIPFETMRRLGRKLWCGMFCKSYGTCRGLGEHESLIVDSNANVACSEVHIDVKHGKPSELKSTKSFELRHPADDNRVTQRSKGGNMLHLFLFASQDAADIGVRPVFRLIDKPNGVGKVLPHGIRDL